jgi:hypothetical protein
MYTSTGHALESLRDRNLFTRERTLLTLDAY